MNSRFVYFRSISLMAAALTCALAAAAHANPDLQAAKRALDELDYQVARTHLESALRWGKNTPAQMREIARLSGEVAAALGDEERAEQFFFQLLALAPKAELPAGSSPKMTAPFARARARVQATGGLTARCLVDRARPSVNAHIDSDPARQVAGARVIYRVPGGSSQIAEARGRDLISVALPATPGLSMYCALIDQHGNHLLELGSDDAPLATLEATPAADSSPLDPRADLDRSSARSQSFFTHYLTWGTLTVAGAGAGGYFAWSLRRDRRALDELNQASREHDFAEALVIEERGQRNALLANISFAAAGTFAVVTFVQFLRRPRDRSASERSALITPALMSDGAGVSLHASF